MTDDTLDVITERLFARDRGRTEADIQSDVRKLLLDAPLELADKEVIDVKLEAPAGEGRRIDVEAGCVAIEVKRSLESKAVFAKAQKQLGGYMQQRTDERGQRYAGVLTDGRTWVLFHLDALGNPSEVGRLQISGRSDAARLVSWLDHVLATTSRVRPTQREIVSRLGSESPGFALDIADLSSLYEACRDDPEVQLKRELWARLLVSALGTNFEDSDELFVAHTYLVITAELLAHAVVGIAVDDPSADVASFLEGSQFERVGIHGVVEADFFDWPALTASGTPIIRAIARRLGRFDWSSVDHDVLKSLYESVIDAETRHKLGEYYTPDWLADHIVKQTIRDPLNQRVLDPACGSGTFLFWAIRHLVVACEDAGMSNREIVAKVTELIGGIDLHPVAVTLARVTYLLALGPERLQDRDEITVPVWLGDSVRWEQDESMLAGGGLTIHTSDEHELFAQELHFPERTVEDPEAFDRLVSELVSRASARKRGSKPLGINGVLNRYGIDDEGDREAVEVVFSRLCGLHDHGRDHIWGYYIRNIARPLSFSREGGKVDVLIGNPPWLAYRHMPSRIQDAYKRLASDRGLWHGGKSATHQDLSALFVARAVEQYLQPSGNFAFVMPLAVLSRRQYEGFRAGDLSSQSGGVNFIEFSDPENFAAVKPSFFPVPCCVVSGRRADSPGPLPSVSVSWSGRIQSHQADWSEVEPQLDRGSEEVVVVTDNGDRSPYREGFRQGATLAPRVLVTVEEVESGPLGMARGRREVQSARSSLEKKPWRDLPSLFGSVEEEFLRPMVTGRSLVAFRLRSMQIAVVPAVGNELLSADDDRFDEFPGLANWWRDAEAEWVKNRSKGSSKMSLLDRVDYQRTLRLQLDQVQHRVVYTRSGQYLAACRLEEPAAIVDTSLYWTSVATVDEARYLTGILNSGPVHEVFSGLQSRGEHNPRDIHLLPFHAPFRRFDADNAQHSELVELSQRAEELVASLEFDLDKRFEVARKVTRTALEKAGLIHDINRVVSSILGDGL